MRLDGKPVTGPGPERGVVFQNYSLLPWLTVYENVALAVDQVLPELAGGAAARARRAATSRWSTSTPARDKRPRELSGGMRQRVSRRARAGDGARRCCCSTSRSARSTR